MSCTVNSLLIPIQLCGGKKTKHPRYNNVSRVLLSFSLAFNANPHYHYYRIRMILRNLNECFYDLVSNYYALKISNKNWTTCLQLNTGDGSPRVFLLNSHFLGAVPKTTLFRVVFHIFINVNTHRNK